MCKRLDKKYYKDLLEILGEEGRARLRSCSGPLAGAWQPASPALPTEQLNDAEYALISRSLLGKAVCRGDPVTCCNMAKTGERAGVPCGEPLGRSCSHAFNCPRGGHMIARTRAVEDVHEAVHRERGYVTAREMHVLAWDRPKWTCGAH